MTLNNYSKSQLEIVQSEKLVWQIGQFSDQIQFASSLETTFVTEKRIGGKNKWDLYIFTKEEDIKIKLRIAEVSKYYSNDIKKFVTFSKCLFSIQDSKELNKMESETIGQYQNNGIYGFYEAVWVVPNFIKRNVLLDKKNGFLPGDQLTIVCKIDFFQTKVHKCILASRSPVFSAMFGHEMLEAQSNKLMIDDIKSDVMEQLLHFIYDGNAPKLENMAEELLVAADKYQLDRLKIQCEYALAKSLTTENACQRFVFAIFHSAKQLKAQAMDFIKKHSNKIMQTDGWKMLNNEQQLELIGNSNDEEKKESSSIKKEEEREKFKWKEDEEEE